VVPQGFVNRALRIIAVTALVALAAAPSSHAAFPGQNGKIVFSSERDEPGNLDLYSMDPDGSNVTRLTTDPAADRNARWSPDGQRIIFQRQISGPWYVINADGSGQAATTLPTNTNHVTWSPDGQKIASTRNGGGQGIFVANPDGSAAVFLGNFRDDCSAPTGGPYREISWSPDGKEIAFTVCTSDGGFIATIDADGSDYQRLTLDFHSAPDWSPDAGRITWWDGEDGNFVAVMNRDGSGQGTIAPGTIPIWSPDGTKIAFQGSGGISLMNPDGTGQTAVSADGTLQDWQPIPVNGYPRPKAASPLRVSLVPAYQPCTTPNRTHGPPLAFGSCHPPAQSSGDLTVGTPDASGAAPASIGHVRLKAVGELPIDPDNGDQSDVEIAVSVTDVRNASNLTDYTGDLTANIGRRITDKDNTPHPGGPGAATTEDNTFSFDVPCAATGGPAGATCALTTTADTLLPGAVVERQRAIWQFDRVAVHDASDDPFLTQGVFIP